MIIKSRSTENTGGGCMVTYLTVDYAGEIKGFGITDESIGALKLPYELWDDADEVYDLWGTNSLKGLQKYLTDEEIALIIPYVIEYCVRFDVSCSMDLGYEYNRLLKLELMRKQANRDKTLTGIVDMIQHIDRSVIEMLDSMDKEGYQDKYDFILEMNGRKLIIPNGADVYEEITTNLFEIFEVLSE
jgi:hypothetical protein